MKKRIISMLLAVCMVVACTLAITPAVSAEGEITITAGDVTGDIGDIVTVPLVVTGTPDEEGIEWNSISMVIYANDAVELLYALDLEGSQIDLGSGKLTNKYAADANPSEIRAHDYYKFAALNPDNGNWYTGEGESVLNLVYQIKSFVKSDIVVDVEAWDTLTEQGGVQIANNFVPGTISVDGGLEKFAMTAEDLSLDKGTFSTASTAYAAVKNVLTDAEIDAYSLKGKAQVANCNLNVDRKFPSVYLSQEQLAPISEIYEEYSNTKVIAKQTGSNATMKTDFYRKKSQLEVPEKVYFADDVCDLYNTYVFEMAFNAPEVYFLGDFDDDALLGIADFSDEGYCTDVIDTLVATSKTVYMWQNSNLWKFFNTDEVKEYVDYIAEDMGSEFAILPLDSFVPVGYQGPAEVTNKKFRVDSAIKYADTQFTVNEEPKNIYDTASCYITVTGRVCGVDVDKKLTKEIGTVYKSLSGVNGVAVPACGAYYFSALAISDLPELQEGEELVFTFTNTVTNIFGGETTSEPVSLTYHADGSITQE